MGSRANLILAVIALALTSAMPAHAGETIYACAHKNSGDLRVVSATGQCLNSEYELSWTDGQNYDQRINELLGRVAAIEAALGVINEAPTVSAGADQTILVSMTADLAGLADDDGLLEPLKFRWQETSGIGGVSITSPESLLTSVSFAAPDTYEMTLSVDDGAITVSDTLQITVYPDNTPPVISTAGTQLIAAERVTINGRWALRCRDVELDATVTDDGKPLDLSYSWEVVSTYAPRVNASPCYTYYPNVSTGFTSQPPASINWPFNITAIPGGPYNYEHCVPDFARAVLALSTTDGYFAADDTLEVVCDVRASDVPVVDAGEDQSAIGYRTDSFFSYRCNGIPLVGTAEDDNLPKPLAITWSVAGHSPVPQYWSAYAYFGDGNALETTANITVRASGSYAPPPPDSVTMTVRLSAYDGYRGAADTVNLTCEKPN